MLTTRQRKLSVLATALAGALALGACGQRDDGTTVGQKVDQTVAKTEQKAEQAKQATEAAAERATQKAEDAARTVGDAVSDAAVTASINAELAKDPSLSALKINVDTTQGHVRLTGMAPTAEARDRATRLAANTKGVNSVDNQLQVGG